ncbi:MAG: hypothetical protein K2X39_08490 [Silvanigrellaceae bacterium]|nr:hypothetical protein [Silvanigrellaceae bacterium]
MFAKIQRQLMIKRAGFVLLALVEIAHLSALPHSYKEECVPLDHTRLSLLLKEKQQLEIIFFSSWCPSCISYLQTSPGENKIFVAVFDSCSRAKRTLNAYQGSSQTCYIDNGIARLFKVKTLPHTLVFKGQTTDAAK